MNRAHYLKTDIRRLIKNYPIYLAIVGVAVSMWFSLEDYAFTEGMVNGNALDTYGFAVSMSGIMIAYAFCAFSYATVFCEDLEYKYARYSINRGNTWKYVVSKAVVVYGASVITMVYVIEVSHVSKSFKDNKVLKDVSLLCESGKIYGLVGHNGSGKTVLFKSICGFLSCDEGTITVNGKVMGKDKDMLTDAGIIIEDPGFLRTWSGYHNLEFLYTLRNKKNKDYLCSVLRKVGLDPALKRPVGKYSLGMRQRLALAQAIMEDPGILILDEPMNGLDKNGVREIRELLLKMKEENKLIILASHNREDIEVLCDEVYEMEGGVISKVKDETN